MIRFVDLRHARISGYRFAFWDTVHDKFIEDDTGCPGWETFDEFVDCNVFTTEFIVRCRRLTPVWAFIPEEAPGPHGVCKQCGACGPQVQEGYCVEVEYEVTPIAKGVCWDAYVASQQPSRAERTALVDPNWRDYDKTGRPPPKVSALEQRLKEEAERSDG